MNRRLPILTLALIGLNVTVFVAARDRGSPTGHPGSVRAGCLAHATGRPVGADHIRVRPQMPSPRGGRPARCAMPSSTDPALPR